MVVSINPAAHPWWPNKILNAAQHPAELGHRQPSLIEIDSEISYDVDIHVDGRPQIVSEKETLFFFLVSPDFSSGEIVVSVYSVYLFKPVEVTRWMEQMYQQYMLEHRWPKRDWKLQYQKP
jgi:hypothetical protein